MDSAAHQWTQEFGVGKSMGDNTRPPPSSVIERKILVRPQKDHVINCPRCQSTNTKFCYYNNYSLTQPRYFCKTCRRYWTEGGTLRNVPVGGGSRKNKKQPSTSCNNNPPSSSSMVLSSVSHNRNIIPDLNPPSSISHFSSSRINPNKIIPDHHQGGHDLNLGYNQLLGQQQDHYHHHGNINIPQFLDFPKIDSSSSSSSALNFLRINNGINGARGFNSFIPMAAATNSLEASNNALFAAPYGNPNDHDQTAQENNINGSLMFTLGSAVNKQHSSTDHAEGDHQDKGQHANANGYWNGMLGGGSW